MIMRILFLSLEFSSATFSGNGIYAISQVRALSAIGNDVMVISGKPDESVDAASNQGARMLIEVYLCLMHAGAQLHVRSCVTCPQSLLLPLRQVPLSRWGTLDAGAPYEEFAEGGSSAQVIAEVLAFRPDVILLVDWSGLDLYRR